MRSSHILLISPQSCNRVRTENRKNNIKQNTNTNQNTKQRNPQIKEAFKPHITVGAVACDLRISPISIAPPHFRSSSSPLSPLDNLSLTNDGLFGSFARCFISKAIRLQVRRPSMAIDWSAASVPFSRRDLIPLSAPSWGMSPAVSTMWGICSSRIRIAVCLSSLCHGSIH